MFSGQWGGMLDWTEKSLRWLEPGQQQQEVEAQTAKLYIKGVKHITSKQQQTMPTSKNKICQN